MHTNIIWGDITSCCVDYNQIGKVKLENLLESGDLSQPHLYSLKTVIIPSCSFVHFQTTFIKSTYNRVMLHINKLTNNASQIKTSLAEVFRQPLTCQAVLLCIHVMPKLLRGNCENKAHNQQKVGGSYRLKT